MVKTKVEGLLHFPLNMTVPLEGSYLQKVIVEASPNRPFYSLVTNTLKRPLKVVKHQVLERPTVSVSGGNLVNVDRH